MSEPMGTAAAGPNGEGSSEEGKDAAKKSSPGSAATDVRAEKMSPSLNEDITLWEEELAVRKEVRNSPISGNFVGAFFVNTYSAMHILVVYLISLESLLSIALSVGMTVCKFLLLGD
jgi:hypothetical protein